MTTSFYPPRELPTVILKQKSAYRLWVSFHKDFPKIEHMGIGQKIENAFLSMLELTFLASYQAPEEKIATLGRTIGRLDLIKFFTQIAWEHKLIPTDKYAELSSQLEEVGKMLGGWKKGLITKLPPK